MASPLGQELSGRTSREFFATITVLHDFPALNCAGQIISWPTRLISAGWIL